jgi:hypothetical protein
VQASPGLAGFSGWFGGPGSGPSLVTAGLFYHEILILYYSFVVFRDRPASDRSWPTPTEENCRYVTRSDEVDGDKEWLL